MNYPLTSSINCGIRRFGLNNTSTLHVPPLASRVIGFVGAILRTPGWCRALAVGVRARVKVIAAGLLFTIGMYFLTTLPTSRGPRFTTLSFGSATSICQKTEESVNIIKTFFKPFTLNRISGLFSFHSTTKFLKAFFIIHQSM